MRQIFKYVADDGVEFRNEADAIKRDETIVRCNEVAEILVPKPGATFRGYIQQSPVTVAYFRERLLSLVADLIPSVKQINGFPEKVIANDITSRYVSDSGIDPLWGLWYRYMCIDAECREWEQAFFALNPGTGKDVCLNPQPETHDGRP